MFAEEGVIFPVGLPQLRKGVVELVNNPDSPITTLLRRLGSMYLEQLKALQQWLDELAAEIDEIFKSSEACPSNGVAACKARRARRRAGSSRTMQRLAHQGLQRSAGLLRTHFMN
ncbi:hypothetical protein HDG34_005100 [Paraburkholderia sp. HC6.4b]|uniref:hypothetical protein n=1 Tax=unclassified Paraburkholderia TaxID=2615204 RepID=UPI0017CE0684|nr:MULTISPECIES: hypothetical protein [unclassified Paraburkholderia]MBB5411140.1 hypothetical protein [Paraburkholderia sp. HC6.4b]MBB5453912.1 hypothetical protein [Paraburkholderia sp. Kb1A]